MSEFEYSSSSSSNENTDEEDLVFPFSIKQNKNIHLHKNKVSKELRLHYSNLFIDTLNLIDLFVKSKKLTYSSFLEIFGSQKFHEIYIKPNREGKHANVSPHHYITITQDSLAVATKFLRSKSREAQIGAVYLLYTMHKTQAFKHYQINIKMVPLDYFNTKELVNNCLNEGLLDPAYCFYKLDMKRNITITATVVNPCLEANYPRLEVRKFMGRVADNNFKIQYEERKDFDQINRLQTMEHQMRNELTYINKLSNLSLGHDVAPEYKAELSQVLIQIDTSHNFKSLKQPNDGIDTEKKKIFWYRKPRAFPGKNEDILEDMVEFLPPPVSEPVDNCHPKKKLKMSKRRHITNKHITKEEESLQKLSSLIESESSCSSINSDDDDDVYGNTCGEMIWRILEGQEINEVVDSKNHEEEDG